MFVWRPEILLLVGQNRRMSKDYERMAQTSETLMAHATR
jgi:hypothetical protein